MPAEPISGAIKVDITTTEGVTTRKQPSEPKTFWERLMAGPQTGRETPGTAGIGKALAVSNKWLAYMAGVTGIAFLVRQSKIASMLMSSTMQILGAIFDVALMPFLPYLAKMLMWFAKLVPLIMKISQDFYNVMEPVRDVLRTINDAIINFFSWIKDHLFPKVPLLEKTKEGILKVDDTFRRALGLPERQSGKFQMPSVVNALKIMSGIPLTGPKGATTEEEYLQDKYTQKRSLLDRALLPLEDLESRARALLDIFFFPLEALESKARTLFDTLTGGFLPLGGLGSKQLGAGYIPSTGLYYLHRGESVSGPRSTSSTTNKSASVTNVFNLSTSSPLGMMNIEQIAAATRKSIEQAIGDSVKYRVSI